MQNTLRSTLLATLFAGLTLVAPLLESRAEACGYGGPAISAADLVDAVVLDAMGGDRATYEVESLRFVSSDRAVVDVRHVAGWRAGQRVRLLARLGESGWRVTGSWALRPAQGSTRATAAL